VLTGFGVLCLVAVLARLPESNPSERRSTAGFRGMVAGYAGILGHKTAVGCILTGGFAFAGMFAYISGTPFVYIQIFGVPPEAYGYLFALNVVSIMGCAVLNAKLVMRIGTVRLMDVGVGLGMAASLALLAAALSGAGGLVGIVVPLFFYVGSLGLIGANAIARASEWFPRQAGATAALFGAVQFGLGAIAGFAVGQWYDDTPVPMAVVIAVCGAMTLGSHVWLVRRDQPASSG
jgi:DHA1 family bicyclomycin/chloramphenicol resistance-like MFS transporter